MKEWPQTWKWWTILLVLWGVVLAGALLGSAADLLFDHRGGSLLGQLPLDIGLSIFLAIVGTLAALHRRRRLARSPGTDSA